MLILSDPDPAWNDSVDPLACRCPNRGCLDDSVAEFVGSNGATAIIVKHFLMAVEIEKLHENRTPAETDYITKGG